MACFLVPSSFMMLKKTYRGLTSSEISGLFKKDVQSIGNQYFRINWNESSDPYPRFVVITSRKLHKSAVRRNRLRRQLYSLVQEHFSDWTVGLRVAILVKTSALELTPQQLRETFLDLLRRAGFLDH